MSASSSNSHGDRAGAPPTLFRTLSANTDQNLSSNRERLHSHYDSNTVSQSLPASQRDTPYGFDDVYFNEAFRFTPSPPPPPSFLNSILNPIESDRDIFGYRVLNSPPRRRRLRSPIDSSPDCNMAPPMRQRDERPARLPMGYIDLTSMPPSPDEPAVPPRPRRQSPQSGPSSKRMKQSDGSALSLQKEELEPTVEETGLSNDNQTVQHALRKQHEDAVKAQERPEEKATTFNSFTCVICMDTPTDLTATACGHLFCHTCLMEALIAGENRAAPSEPRRSQCPVCRKFINRSKSTDVIPLLLQKGLATQPRKKSSVVAASKVTS